MFTPSFILANLIFGTIGLSSFSYGKKLELWKPKLIGMVLMFYSYFFNNLWLVWGTGIALLVLLWFHHDE